MVKASEQVMSPAATVLQGRKGRAVFARAEQVAPTDSSDEEWNPEDKCPGVRQRGGRAMRTGPGQRCRGRFVSDLGRRVGNVSQTCLSSCGWKVRAELSVERRESLFRGVLSALS